MNHSSAGSLNNTYCHSYHLSNTYLVPGPLLSLLNKLSFDHHSNSCFLIYKMWINMLFKIAESVHLKTWFMWINHTLKLTMIALSITSRQRMPSCCSEDTFRLDSLGRVPVGDCLVGKIQSGRCGQFR